MGITAVVLGGDPRDTMRTTDGLFGAGPPGVNFQAATLIPAENAGPIFDIEKSPREPCVGMSIFYLENEKTGQSDDTSDTIWGLYWVLRVVGMKFPQVLTSEWQESAGHSVSVDFENENKEEDNALNEISEEDNALNEIPEEDNALNETSEEDKQLIEDFKFILKKAHEGDMEYQSGLGSLYLKGMEFGETIKKGNKPDYKNALLWLTKAAKQGHDRAQVNLGIMYLSGYGVSKDVELALDLWCKSARQGYVEAQYELGKIYFNGKHVTTDYEQANYWYTKAAEQGHSDAQIKLGLMFSDGQGVTQDDEKAFAWFKIAADQGSDVGQNNIGCCYLDGEGVTQDYEKAFAWFKKSAEQGFCPAQVELGDMCAIGKGVKKSLKDAAYWVNLAHNNSTIMPPQKDEAEKLWDTYELWKYIDEAKKL